MPTCFVKKQRQSPILYFNPTITEIERSPLIIISVPCRNVRCKHYAICIATSEDVGVCRCPQKCYDNKDPVCGDDGETYENECELKRASCKQQKRIMVEEKGACGRYKHEVINFINYCFLIQF